MTPMPTPASSAPPGHHPLRPNLRQATFILPRTGERVKRSVTLRDPPASTARANGDAPADDATPLLGHRRSLSRSAGSWPRIREGVRTSSSQAWSFARSKTGRGILKCSLAYLLGSLATFVGPIAALLGKQDGKHTVATITVYFHPARSQGSMYEATLLAFAALLYALFISISSMGVSVGFGQLGQKTLGHALVLILFCGGGLGFVGWLKQRLGNPLVNVACSLASLAIITVLTKEGAVQMAVFSDDKITQVMKMVVMGVLATTVVSLIIDPISARKELRQTMIKATDSLGDMLAMVTRGFLNGSEELLQDDAFKSTADQYKSVFSAMTKQLQEAKYEHFALGTEAEYRIEARLVECMQRLAQNIGGLRSAATTQFTLLSEADISAALPSVFTPTTPGSHSQHSFPLPSIDEVAEEGSEGRPSPQPETDASPAGPSTVESPTDIFSLFVLHLGPSMKSLAFTLKQILDELPYSSEEQYLIAVNSQFRDSLDEAITLYSAARKEALKLIYQTTETTKARSRELAADLEEVAASCGYFSFSLHNFAEDMKTYLEILDDWKTETERYPRHRTWNWMRFWRRGNRASPSTAESDPEYASLLDGDARVDSFLNAPNPTKRRRPGSATTAKERAGEAFQHRIWRAVKVFQRDDVRFAIKVGVGAALYALPSFVASTRPFYSRWRGEWGLLSYMLVCSMTIGSSNTTGFARFVGTCMGAVVAILAWIATQGNVYGLAIIGWLFSIFCFYIIIAQGRGPMGRFILLTYNLSALYAYSLSVKDEDDDDDEGGINPHITEITTHRVVAVLTGCLWGLIITRLIWPISARRKFTQGLSLLWLRMGLIWRRDPLSALLEGQATNTHMDLREELDLQQYISRLDGWREAARSEFELRGSFPNEAYQRVLKSTSAMLDAFHAMNIMILKDARASEGEAEILRYTAKERAQLSARISHLFQGTACMTECTKGFVDADDWTVLASSLKLEYPLNDAIPNIEHTRDRLLAKVFSYRSRGPEVQEVSDEDFSRLYAYGM
ncbi:MAG: hypothetical protein M1817_000977 [Caeruleum heppii]|nr:MAG: hypothetical protein M1817_000977 [Caeruleum heppii]